MSLRLMLAFVPDRPQSELEDLLKDRNILGIWRDTATADRLTIQLLLPAEQTEAVMDDLEQAFGGEAGFCVVLLPVEAVLPRSKSDADETDGEGQSEEEEAAETGRVSREELYNNIGESLGVNRVFLAMTMLSTVVAAVGLLRNDVAVIIGAMVIAPLLGPNVGMSLAVTLGDVALLRKALITNAIGVTVALLISIVVGVALHVDAEVPAIAQRSVVHGGDLLLALAAGSAGTFAFTRGLTGAVIGVMVAVALMPPLVTFGMLLGSGHYRAATGALLLVVANVVCVNLAGVATFAAQGVRPRTWWEGERARRDTRLAVLIWLVLLVVLATVLAFNPAS